MDPHGNIYPIDADDMEAMRASLTEPVDETQREKFAELREDMARIDGYLKARAEADAPKRERPNDDLTRRTS